jgi:hypothetical protein
MDAVEVHRVRVPAAVDEADPQAIALPRAQRRPGDAPVVGPRRELHPRRNLDLLLGGGDRPLAQRAPVGQAADLALVEVAQDQVRVKAVGAVVDLAAAKSRVAVAGMPRAPGGRRSGVVFGGGGAAVRVRDRGMHDGRTEPRSGDGAQQTAACQTGHD